MTSYTSKGQRVGGAVPKDNRPVFFFFREEIEFVETEIKVFADGNHIDRELKRRRHPRSLYTWCTRRIVENEASARRNLLDFLREKRTTCLSVGVKLYLKVRLLFSCVKEVRARTYLKLGKDLQFRKTSLLTRTVLITSNGRLEIKS